MAAKGKKTIPRDNAKMRRHHREKRRRQREMRKHPPGPKEKLVSGCLAALFVGGILFLVAVTWTCLVAE
ncbi:MAG: hypothetical protein AAF533_15585 [Acidobacteriota bacterium]